MEPRTIPSSPEEFAGLLHELRLGRRQRKESLRAEQPRSAVAFSGHLHAKTATPNTSEGCQR
jgi:hypothetical protein